MLNKAGGQDALPLSNGSGALVVYSCRFISQPRRERENNDPGALCIIVFRVIALHLRRVEAGNGCDR